MPDPTGPNGTPPGPGPGADRAGDQPDLTWLIAQRVASAQQRRDQAIAAFNEIAAAHGIPLAILHAGGEVLAATEADQLARYLQAALSKAQELQPALTDDQASIVALKATARIARDGATNRAVEFVSGIGHPDGIVIDPVRAWFNRHELGSDVEFLEWVHTLKF